MERELLDHIQRYLDADCTLQDLEAWVLSNLQAILDSGDEETIRAADQIDADLVELGEGLMDEITLREHLQSYVSLKQSIPFVFSETEPRDTVQASTAVETIRTQSEVPGPVVNLRLAHRFA